MLLSGAILVEENHDDVEYQHIENKSHNSIPASEQKSPHENVCKGEATQS